ncbi:hypothetical protein GH714_014103 [Hevea brasiliensis]|uniref:Disease resistance N-terminal domain-containing protein n=1 Tax=Hevea brasiliensis TaxID=3981 RepID=A0A6A6N426_HEVBR|nr:hypothetical protein GH714_014103 [Hevea brasiliensis]
MYATSLLSRFMHEPSQNHFKAPKRVLRYVKGTINLGIWFKSGMEGKLVGYADSDWGGSIDEMKSTSETMAEMILSFGVDATLSRVASLITDEIIGAWNLKDDLQGLQESLTMIGGVLQDAEEQQTRREHVRLWLKKLKEVAYEAEDVFDELAYENLR